VGSIADIVSRANGVAAAAVIMPVVLLERFFRMGDVKM
jgi:hypothetical protein